MGLGFTQTHLKRQQRQLAAAAVPARPAGQPSWPAAVPATGGGSESEREGVSEREGERGREK